MNPLKRLNAKENFLLLLLILFNFYFFFLKFEVDNDMAEIKSFSSNFHKWQNDNFIGDGF